MSPGTLYWLAICSVVGAALYSEMLDRSSSDDALDSGAEGDIPFIAAEHLKSLFHARSNGTGA
jgi:hypothetical protein